MKRALIGIVQVMTAIALITGCASDRAARQREGAALRNIGEAYMIEDQYTSALKELLKADELTPDDPFLQNDLGLVYLKKERPQLALARFRKAIELKPDYADAMNNLAAVYLNLKQWDKAIEYLNMATNDLLYTAPQNAYVNLGYAYQQKKEFEKSEKYYRQAIGYYEDGFAKDVTYLRAMGGLADTYVAAGNPEEALKVLKTAVDAFPQVARLHLEMGRVYQALKDVKKAYASYRKAIQLAPEGPVARSAREQIKSLNTGG